MKARVKAPGVRSLPRAVRRGGRHAPVAPLSRVGRGSADGSLRLGRSRVGRGLHDGSHIRAMSERIAASALRKSIGV